MKKIQEAWVTSPSSLVTFLATTGGSKTNYVTLCEVGLAMEEHQWVKVGTAEIEYTFKMSDEVYSAAEKSINEKIAELEQKHWEQINTLKEFRATLLCLEAPKPGSF